MMHLHLTMYFLRFPDTLQRNLTLQESVVMEQIILLVLLLNDKESFRYTFHGYALVVCRNVIFSWCITHNIDKNKKNNVHGYKYM